MDKRTTGVILGMVAGDACINIRDRTRQMQSWHTPSAYQSSEIRILHGMQQRAYCEFKSALLNKLLGRNSSVTVVRNGPSGKYEAAQFSISHPYFKLIKNWAYPNGVKTFNQLWLDHITPEGIALWYMDDGHARRNIDKNGYTSSVATSIATCCSKPEAELICDWFRSVHKIMFKPFPEKGNWSIQANTAETRQFVHLVQPYIVEPMLYKISHAADLNSHECRAPFGKCECGATIYDNRRKGLCTACYSRRYYRDVVRFKG